MIYPPTWEEICALLRHLRIPGSCDADLPLGESHVGGTLGTLAVERAYFAAADTHALKLQTLSVK